MNQYSAALDPPGPIENSRIAVTKNGVTSIRHNSDYGQLSESMWRFLHDIYGGGPQLALKQPQPPPQPQQPQQQIQERSASPERVVTSSTGGGEGEGGHMEVKA